MPAVIPRSGGRLGRRYAQHQQYLLGQSQSRSQVQRYSLTLGRLRKSWASVTRSVAPPRTSSGGGREPPERYAGPLRTGKRQHHQAGMGQSGGGQVSSRLASPYDTGAPIARPASPVGGPIPAANAVCLPGAAFAQQQPDVIRPTDDHMVAQRPARSATSPSSACGG